MARRYRSEENIAFTREAVVISNHFGVLPKRKLGAILASEDDQRQRG